MEEKQKKYPNAVYVKDKNKVLVQEWGLTDESYDVLLFNKKGEVIYSYVGTLDDQEIQKVSKLIDKNL